MRATENIFGSCSSWKKFALAILRRQKVFTLADKALEKKQFYKLVR